jgi:hypothetical protein
MANDLTVVFLDANVLARPITRTLLIAGASDADLTVAWSAYVEEEAERHLPGRAMSMRELRVRHQFQLVPTGVDPERFAGSSAKDRQVLADADAARAAFLVTSDVDDVADGDLASLRMTAIDSDLFMALRFSRRAYVRALDLLVANMKNPPRTTADMHALLGRQHPRLVAAHFDAFDVEVASPLHQEPRELVRGVRCVSCESVVDEPGELVLGVCVDCRP